jgi:hypothetical protein
MTNPYNIIDLPKFPALLHELNQLIAWEKYMQICLNAPPGHEDDHQFGEGSLVYDWGKSEQVWNKETNSFDWVVPKKEIIVQESDFTETTTLFKDSVLEELLDAITSRFKVGRVRIMRSKPKTCLSWHKDDTMRLHYPFFTREECKMIVGDDVFHLPEHQWSLVDTTVPHTALNASKLERLHIVACIL